MIEEKLAEYFIIMIVILTSIFANENHGKPAQMARTMRKWK
jgi:hypothetical protein